MITPQFTYDNSGNKIGVFLAIEDWAQLQEIPEVNELSNMVTSIPAWQVELGKAELLKLKNGSAELLSWEETKKQLHL